MDILVLFGTFILLVILTIPIGYAIGISTLVTLVFFTNMPLALITQNAITGVDSFPLMAIPFFILSGALMEGGGLSKRLVLFFGPAHRGLLRHAAWLDHRRPGHCDHPGLYDLCGHLRLGHGHHLRHRRLYDPRDDQAGL